MKLSICYQILYAALGRDTMDHVTSVSSVRIVIETVILKVNNFSTPNGNKNLVSDLMTVTSSYNREISGGGLFGTQKRIAYDVNGYRTLSKGLTTTIK